MHTPVTFSLQRLLSWLGAGLLVAGLIWLLSPVLAPFVVAAVLAYVLQPLVLRLQGWGVPRLLAVMLVEALALVALLGLFLLLVPVLVREWPLLRQQLPLLLDRLDAALHPLLAQLGISWSLDLPDLKTQLMGWLNDNRDDLMKPVLASLKVGGSVVLTVVGFAVLVPVALFFMLSDWAKLVATVFDLLCANYGLDRGLGGDFVARDFSDSAPYTPAWAEKITGVPADAIITAAREFAANAEAVAAVPAAGRYVDDKSGMSPATSARNVGAAALPDAGPENTRFAVCVASEPVSVPDVVTGEPVTVNMAGNASDTLVTVPKPENVVGIQDEPDQPKYCPTVAPPLDSCVGENMTDGEGTAG
mgnify:CR=1 FL=1